ncbi:MAG: response regulator [Oscillospiraceae bacterium]|nr:response regulator [Oscillospiraceae bacterium]
MVKKLLIADCNEELQFALKQALQDRFEIRCCDDGHYMLSLLKQDVPDLLILDPLLKNLDGISALNWAAESGVFTKVLIVSSYLSEYLYAQPERLGIQYCIRKPCDINALIARILDLSGTPNFRPPPQDPRKLATAFQLSLQLDAQHHGFPYLVDAIAMAVKDPSLRITKDIYPELAKCYRCNTDHIERSIRSALEVGWKRGDRELWLSHFPNAKKRPRNGEFVFHAAAIVRQQME